MQLLCERALLVHFSVTPSSANLDVCLRDSGPTVWHLLRSCSVRELCSYTLVLLSALQNWISDLETANLWSYILYAVALWESFAHTLNCHSQFCIFGFLSMRRWTHGPTSIMQLLYERASPIHFKVLVYVHVMWLFPVEGILLLSTVNYLYQCFTQVVNMLDSH